MLNNLINNLAVQFERRYYNYTTLNCKKNGKSNCKSLKKQINKCFFLLNENQFENFVFLMQNIQKTKPSKFSEEDSKIFLILKYFYTLKTKNKLVLKLPKFATKTLMGGDLLGNIIFCLKTIKYIKTKKGIKYIRHIKNFFFNEFNIVIDSKKPWNKLEEYLINKEKLIEKENAIYMIVNLVILLLVDLKLKKEFQNLMLIKKKIYFFLQNVNFKKKTVMNFLNLFFPLEDFSKKRAFSISTLKEGKNLESEKNLILLKSTNHSTFFSTIKKTEYRKNNLFESVNSPQLLLNNDKLRPFSVNTSSYFFKKTNGKLSGFLKGGEIQKEKKEEYQDILNSNLINKNFNSKIRERSKSSYQSKIMTRNINKEINYEKLSYIKKKKKIQNNSQKNFNHLLKNKTKTKILKKGVSYFIDKNLIKNIVQKNLFNFDHKNRHKKRLKKLMRLFRGIVRVLLIFFQSSKKRKKNYLSNHFIKSIHFYNKEKSDKNKSKIIDPEIKKKSFISSQNDSNDNLKKENQDKNKFYSLFNTDENIFFLQRGIETLIKIINKNKLKEIFEKLKLLFFLKKIKEYKKIGNMRNKKKRKIIINYKMMKIDHKKIEEKKKNVFHFNEIIFLLDFGEFVKLWEISFEVRFEKNQNSILKSQIFFKLEYRIVKFIFIFKLEMKNFFWKLKKKKTTFSLFITLLNKFLFYSSIKDFTISSNFFFNYLEIISLHERNKKSSVRFLKHKIAFCLFQSLKISVDKANLDSFKKNLLMNKNHSKFIAFLYNESFLKKKKYINYSYIQSKSDSKTSELKNISKNDFCLNNLKFFLKKKKVYIVKRVHLKFLILKCEFQKKFVKNGLFDYKLEIKNLYFSINKNNYSLKRIVSDYEISDDDSINFDVKIRAFIKSFLGDFEKKVSFDTHYFRKIFNRFQKELINKHGLEKKNERFLNCEKKSNANFKLQSFNTYFQDGSKMFIGSHKLDSFNCLNKENSQNIITSKNNFLFLKKITPENIKIDSLNKLMKQENYKKESDVISSFNKNIFNNENIKKNFKPDNVSKLDDFYETKNFDINSDFFFDEFVKKKKEVIYLSNYLKIKFNNLQNPKNVILLKIFE